MTFDSKVKQAIPATIYMFSGADDSQQANELSNVKTFELPDPAGKTGGACTSALLQTLWRDEDNDDIRYTWSETLELMREKIEDIGLTQVPQLSVSRPINIHDEIHITPPDCDGVKRALLVGVNYTGDSNALTSCHSDIRNMKEFLMKVHGFERENMLILMDDGNHHEPTKHLFLSGMKRLCEISKPGDCIFFQFSGHGGQIVDSSGDEDDGKDEILFPGDYKDAGTIVDDEIYDNFVSQIPAGVHVVAMVDCCHSGTAMDLPYVCGVDDDELRPNEGCRALSTKGKPSKKKTKSRDKKTDKKSKKKNTGDKETKKGKKSKAGSKKKKKASKEEDPVDDGDDHGEDEEYEEVERREEPKKRKGLFGFGLLR